jgi:hypothetical protein
VSTPNARDGSWDDARHWWWPALARGCAGETPRVCHLQFRVETFNLFNTPQFNNPNVSIGSAIAGTISSAGRPADFSRTSRQIQLALKFYF